MKIVLCQCLRTSRLPKKKKKLFSILSHMLIKISDYYFIIHAHEHNNKSDIRQIKLNNYYLSVSPCSSVRPQFAGYVETMQSGS